MLQLVMHASTRIRNRHLQRLTLCQLSEQEGLSDYRSIKRLTTSNMANEKYPVYIRYPFEHTANSYTVCPKIYRQTTGKATDTYRYQFKYKTLRNTGTILVPYKNCANEIYKNVKRQEF